MSIWNTDLTGTLKFSKVPSVPLFVKDKPTRLKVERIPREPLSPESVEFSTRLRKIFRRRHQIYLKLRDTSTLLTVILEFV